MGGPAGEGPGFVGVDVGLGPRGVKVSVGVVEEAHPVFGFEYAAAGFVDVLLGHASFFERLLEGPDEPVAVHVQVDSGLKGPGGDFLEVAEPVCGDLVDCGGVCDDEAVEAPESAQDVIEQVLVAGGGHALDLVERAHVASGARLAGLLVGAQVYVEHGLAVHGDGVVVPSRLGCPVQGVVLYAGHHLVVAFEAAVALVAAHHGLRDFTYEIGVLSGTFGNPAPPGIPGDVNHGAEHPADSERAGFLRRTGRALLDEVHVPRACQRERYGECGLETVYGVYSEHKGDSEAGLLDGDFLQGGHLADVLHAVEGSESAVAQQLQVFRAGVAREVGPEAGIGHQVELAYLLLDRHLGHQPVDEPVHFTPRAAPGRENGSRTDCHCSDNQFFGFHRVMCFCISLQFNHFSDARTASAGFLGK